MATLEKLGAFALTEPLHGSDSVALETSARRDGDRWVINGQKKWIGNGTLADVVVVWARDVGDGQVKGFLVEKGTPGYDARRMDAKGSLRAVWQAEITLTEVRVPEENRLPGADVNPYLAISAILAAGLHGIDKGLSLEEEFVGNAYDSDKPTVPATLRDARDLFAGSEVARQAFGPEVVDHYCNMARVELDAFDAAVTDWERYRGFERL
jgi:alkylation response protein AidB-like acyl-CoA dehydrogenase